MQQQSQQPFREDEIITMVHWDKQAGQQVQTQYPKLAGRLRLAHENNDQLTIKTSIVNYDGSVAVVTAVATTDAGSFSGIGMASLERDAKIAPAILELAESRAIARSLRFSGIGVEYCSAEEISHLPSDNRNGDNGDATRDKQPSRNNSPQKGFKPVLVPAGTQGIQASKEPGNGNGGVSSSSNGRLSGKQLVFIMRLANARGFTKKDLDMHCVNVFGVATDFLSKKEASTLIDELSTAEEAQHA